MCVAGIFGDMLVIQDLIDSEFTSLQNPEMHNETGHRKFGQRKLSRQWVAVRAGTGVHGGDNFHA